MQPNPPPYGQYPPPPQGQYPPPQGQYPPPHAQYPPPYHPGYAQPAMQQQQQQTTVVVNTGQREYVTVREDRGCMPDTTDWKWYNWLLAVLAVVILGPIVLAVAIVCCCIMALGKEDR